MPGTHLSRLPFSRETKPQGRWVVCTASRRREQPRQRPGMRGRWRSVETPHPQQPKQTSPRAQRHKYEFTLTLSPRYARVGPVKVSLHNLDRKNNYFDLSIMLGDFRLDKKHVRPYEPLWITWAASSTPIRLLADRIGKNEVHGYLSSPEQKARRPVPAGHKRRTPRVLEPWWRRQRRDNRTGADDDRSVPVIGSRQVAIPSTTSP